MLKDLVLKNRSYRRFHQEETVSLDTLRELIDLARLSPSAANLQPLKYILSNEPERNTLIFRHLSWAGYLKDWPGPAEGERPAAYIIILLDNTIASTVDCDHGIAAHSIMLGATEKGLGGCIIGSVLQKELCEALSIPEHYEVLLVLALGRPAEEIIIEPATEAIRYYRDERDVHHVPKRPLERLIIG